MNRRAEAGVHGTDRADAFPALFEDAPCGYLATSADGTIVHANRTIHDWLGYRSATLPDTRFQDLLRIGARMFYETQLLPLLQMEGHADEIALDFSRADGSILQALNNVSIARRGDGSIDVVRIAVFNTAVRRSFEHELVTARRELAELADSLEARVADGIRGRLELEQSLRQSQKMEAVGQLTGGLAHDFNNLLTGISGSLELLLIRTAQGRTGPELERYIHAAQGAAKRAATLTHRLLAFARRQTLDPKPTDVNRLIVDLEELLRRSVEPAVGLDVVGAPDLWSALVDANQLENALLNLCINARDAMPDGGRITIETANRRLDERTAREQEVEPGAYLAIAVGDTGAGMTAEVLQRAFEPFFTTKPLGSGTGLGLSMVHGFARQSGGQVRIESEVGRGTTITVLLPRHRGAVESPAFGEPEAEGRAPNALETILVVDDEPTVRMLVLEVLTDLGYRVIETSDGPSALQVLQSGQRVDLLVTDVGLPGGIDGRRLADASRELRPSLKVLLITGYANHAVLADAQPRDRTDVMTKPFSIGDLVGRVSHLMKA